MKEIIQFPSGLLWILRLVSTLRDWREESTQCSANHGIRKEKVW